MHKPSKPVRKPSNVDIKSTTIRHLKTAFDLQRPIRKAKLNVKELETIEKPNVFKIKQST